MGGELMGRLSAGAVLRLDDRTGPFSLGDRTLAALVLLSVGIRSGGIRTLSHERPSERRLNCSRAYSTPSIQACRHAKNV